MDKSSCEKSLGWSDRLFPADFIRKNDFGLAITFYDVVRNENVLASIALPLV